MKKNQNKLCYFFAFFPPKFLQFCRMTRIQNLDLFCQFFLKILSKNQIMTSIKDRNSVPNLRKNKDLQYQRRYCQ